MASRSQWDDTIKALQGMGYAQNPAAPPAPPPNSFGDAAAAMNHPGTVQPRNTFGSVAAQAATPSAPAAPAGPAARPVSPSGLYFQDRGQELKDQVGQGQYAQALGTAARTAVQGAGMYALEAGDKLTSPWIDAAKGFGRGLVGDTAAQPAAPAAPAPVGPSNPTDQRLAAGTQAAPMGLADAALASAPAAPGNQLMPGVYQHGKGQYSDSAAGMGFEHRRGEQPSAQNMAAADALAQQHQQQSLARLALQQAQPSAPQQPWMQGDGLAARAMQQQPAAAQPAYSPNASSGFAWMSDLRDPRNLALRNAGVVGTQFSSKGQELLATRAARARVGEVQKAIDAQMHGAQQADTARLQSENTLTGTLGAEAMRQDGANQRTMAEAALEQQKINQAGEAAGYANRRESMIDRIRSQVAAEPDPTKRRGLVDYMRDVEGRGPAEANLRNNFMTRKVPVYDEKGRPILGESREEIVDLRTLQGAGQWGQQPGQGGAPEAAIAALRADPRRAAEFDQKFGAGAAGRVLGRMGGA